MKTSNLSYLGVDELRPLNKENEKVEGILLFGAYFPCNKIFLKNPIFLELFCTTMGAAKPNRTASIASSQPAYDVQSFNIY